MGTGGLKATQNSKDYKIHINLVQLHIFSEWFMFSLSYTVYGGCRGRLLSDTFYWHWSVPVAPGISLSEETKPYGMLHVTCSPAHLCEYLDFALAHHLTFTPWGTVA